eukprot:12903120-Prorocentrum_lima.AAC.1
MRWDGSTEPIDFVATTNILRLNKMGQRLMEMTCVLGIMRGELSPQYQWMISPPIAGVSAMARFIRGSHQDEN